MHNLLVMLLAAASVALSAVLFAEDAQMPAAPFNVPTTAETLVALGNTLSWSSGNGKAIVRAWVNLVVGTGTTSIAVLIYRGAAIGGPLIGVSNYAAGTFTPGNLTRLDAEFLDSVQDVSGVQYCMSVIQTGATADGIVQSALINTTMLSG